MQSMCATGSLSVNMSVQLVGDASDDNNDGNSEKTMTKFFARISFVSTNIDFEQLCSYSVCLPWHAAYVRSEQKIFGLSEDDNARFKT